MPAEVIDLTEDGDSRTGPMVIDLTEDDEPMPVIDLSADALPEALQPIIPPRRRSAHLPIQHNFESLPLGARLVAEYPELRRPVPRPPQVPRFQLNDHPTPAPTLAPAPLGTAPAHAPVPVPVPAFAPTPAPTPGTTLARQRTASTPALAPVPGTQSAHTPRAHPPLAVMMTHDDHRVYKARRADEQLRTADKHSLLKKVPDYAPPNSAFEVSFMISEIGSTNWSLSRRWSEFSARKTLVACTAKQSVMKEMYHLSLYFLESLTMPHAGEKRGLISQSILLNY